jgi:hypothetical protein
MPPDVLGHLNHHVSPQCPKELRMVMCEVPLSRFEELLLGIAREARPALAVGDPTVPFRDLGRLAFVIAACRHPERPAEGFGWGCPGFHFRQDPPVPL